MASATQITIRVSDLPQFRAVIEAAAAWLQNYGEVEVYDDERFCTQLSHGHEEYQQRIDLIAAFRDLEKLSSSDKDAA